MERRRLLFLGSILAETRVAFTNAISGENWELFLGNLAAAGISVNVNQDVTRERRHFGVDEPLEVPVVLDSSTENDSLVEAGNDSKKIVLSPLSTISSKMTLDPEAAPFKAVSLPMDGGAVRYVRSPTPAKPTTKTPLPTSSSKSAPSLAMVASKAKTLSDTYQPPVQSANPIPKPPRSPQPKSLPPLQPLPPLSPSQPAKAKPQASTESQPQFPQPSKSQPKSPVALDLPQHTERQPPDGIDDSMEALKGSIDDLSHENQAELDSSVDGFIDDSMEVLPVSVGDCLEVALGMNVDFGIKAEEPLPGWEEEINPATDDYPPVFEDPPGTGLNGTEIPSRYFHQQTAEISEEFYRTPPAEAASFRYPASTAARSMSIDDARSVAEAMYARKLLGLALHTSTPFNDITGTTDTADFHSIPNSRFAVRAVSTPRSNRRRRVGGGIPYSCGSSVSPSPDRRLVTHL